MVDAVVEYDYEAKEEDELNITKGDIITNIHKLDGGWWEGTLNGKTGVFPDNFVKEIEKEKKKSKDLSSSIKRGSASGGAGGGHVAELANKLGKEGLKVGGAGPPKRDSKPPGNSVESPPILAAGAATGPLPHRVRVAHSYTPKNDDELELIVGQIVNVTNKEEEGWWEGTLNDGRAGVFPSNFVEELKEEAPEENADEFHAIQGKKIKGIGFGNIFAGGPVKLKGAKKQESGDSTTEPPKPPPQEAKRKSQAPPVPSSEPQNAAPKEKQVYLPTKSKSLSALESSSHSDSAPLKHTISYMSDCSGMDYFPLQSNTLDTQNQHGSDDIIGDHRRQSNKTEEDEKYAVDGGGTTQNLPCGNEEYYYSDSSDEDPEKPVWRKMTQEALVKFKLWNRQPDCMLFDDDGMEHTSVDCMVITSDDSDDNEDEYEVYVPYTDDVSNTLTDGTGRAPQGLPPQGSGSEENNQIAPVSDPEQGSFLKNAANNSSSSERAVPLEVGSLSHARETPPPKLTFRKRRSISTPKNSPVPAIRSDVTPPQVDKPPIKKQRVSPTSSHRADREGPLGLVPLDSITCTGQYAGSKRPIDSVPEESFAEDTTISTNTSMSQYYSARESCASGEFYTLSPDPPESNDNTMLGFSDTMGSDYSDRTRSPEDNINTITSPGFHYEGRKRVSFSPQDLYIAPSGKKLNIPNFWAHTPLKYLRKRPSSSTSNKPLEVEHITDSVKLIRHRRLAAQPIKLKHQAVQVNILPEMKSYQDVATETDARYFVKSPVRVKSPKSPVKAKNPLQIVDTSDENLPQYVHYSVKDKERIHRQHSQQSLDEKAYVPLKDVYASKVPSGKASTKVKRRSSLAATIASAFAPKRNKSVRGQSEVNTPLGLVKRKDDRRSLPVSLPPRQTQSNYPVKRLIGRHDSIVVSVDEAMDENRNPLNDRDSQSENAFVLDPVLVQDNNDSVLTFKSATLPLSSANTSTVTYQVPVKFASTDNLSYFEFMQSRGRISPAIRNIANKYRISTGGLQDYSIQEEDDSHMEGSTNVSKVDENEGNVQDLPASDGDVRKAAEEKYDLSPAAVRKFARLASAMKAKQQDLEDADVSTNAAVTEENPTSQISVADVLKREVHQAVEDSLNEKHQAMEQAGEETMTKTDQAIVDWNSTVQKEQETVQEVCSVSAADKECRNESEPISKAESTERVEEIDSDDVDKLMGPGDLESIYENLRNIKDLLSKSIGEEELKLENVSDNNMTPSAIRKDLDEATNTSGASNVSVNSFSDTVKLSAGTQTSGPPLGRHGLRRKKFYTPPNLGKAQRVLVSDEKPGYLEDYKMYMHQLPQPLRPDVPNEKAQDEVDVAPQRKSAAKKKLSRRRSLFQKFRKSKVGIAKEDENPSPSVKVIVTGPASKRPKVSLFRRLSQKIRGRKYVVKGAEGGATAGCKGVTFSDAAELCLPDNSNVAYNARKDLFGGEDETSSSSSSSADEGDEEVSTAGSEEKILDTAATEADSMKVLIDKDDQLAMEEELNGHEEDWQVLNSILNRSSEKEKKSSKERITTSIKDEYIDDELNDSMELTGDLYKPSQMEEDVLTPRKVVLEIENENEPACTSTPSKHGCLSPSLEILFQDTFDATAAAAAESTQPRDKCSGDFVKQSPAISSYNSVDVSDLVSDTPEKRRYYNLTNQELSPSIGGTGDADHTLKEMSHASSLSEFVDVQNLN